MDEDDDGPVTPQEQLVSDYLDTLNAGTPATHAEMLARFPTLTPAEQASARHGMEATDWLVDLARKAGLRRDALNAASPAAAPAPDAGVTMNADKDPSAKATLARLPVLDSGLAYCPTCGELEAWCICDLDTDEAPDSAPDYEHDEACPCERCVDERAYIGELADMGLIP